jgi:hypothetical protein
LFDAMGAGEIQLVTGLRVSRARGRRAAVDALVSAMRSRACRSIRVRVRAGEAGTIRHITVGDLIDRWADGRSLVNVTDFHVRGTPLERVFDLSHLSGFNLLCGQTEAIATEEIMTMVVSARGCVTDSHSDDPDGSNHCFTGCKLWLVWDTFEGRAHGLQDVERDDVLDYARFDLPTFLSLRTSRWFTVRAGETLFLPGHLTHKVITLEPYLGIGSFYVSIPNCVRTVARWLEHGALWEIGDKNGSRHELVNSIADVARLRIAALRKSDRRTQERSGLPALRRSVKTWRRATAAAVQRRLGRNAAFAALLDVAAS